MLSGRGLAFADVRCLFVGRYMYLYRYLFRMRSTRQMMRTMSWYFGAGGEANGTDDEQRAVQHEYRRAGGEARAVPRHGNAIHGQPQGAAPRCMSRAHVVLYKCICSPSPPLASCLGCREGWAAQSAHVCVDVKHRVVNATNSRGMCEHFEPGVACVSRFLF